MKSAISTNTSIEIIYPVNRKRPVSLTLTVNGQGIVFFHTDALGNRQRRAVAEDQFHIAADGDTLGDGGAFLHKVPACRHHDRLIPFLDCRDRLRIHGLFRTIAFNVFDGIPDGEAERLRATVIARAGYCQRIIALVLHGRCASVFGDSLSIICSFDQHRVVIRCHGVTDTDFASRI